MLTAKGYAVTAVADGAQARAQVAASLPELVILDLVLPEVSGFELLGEWRASPRTADLPVFILTSSCCANYAIGNSRPQDGPNYGSGSQWSIPWRISDTGKDGVLAIGGHAKISLICAAVQWCTICISLLA